MAERFDLLVVGGTRGRMFCDHAFYAGATPENASRLGELEGLPGGCGVKVFMGSSTGSFAVDFRIMELVPDRVHLYSLARLYEGANIGGRRSP